MLFMWVREEVLLCVETCIYSYCDEIITVTMLPQAKPTDMDIPDCAMGPGSALTALRLGIQSTSTCSPKPVKRLPHSPASLGGKHLVLVPLAGNTAASLCNWMGCNHHVSGGAIVSLTRGAP